MAAEGEIQQEVREHRAGYASFVRLMRWGAIISLITTFIVILLIA